MLSGTARTAPAHHTPALARLPILRLLPGPLPQEYWALGSLDAPVVLELRPGNEDLCGERQPWAAAAAAVVAARLPLGTAHAITPATTPAAPAWPGSPCAGPVVPVESRLFLRELLPTLAPMLPPLPVRPAPPGCSAGWRGSWPAGGHWDLHLQPPGQLAASPKAHLRCAALPQAQVSAASQMRTGLRTSYLMLTHANLLAPGTAVTLAARLGSCARPCARGSQAPAWARRAGLAWPPVLETNLYDLAWRYGIR